MATNLTSKQIKAWKKSVETAISSNLVTSLKKAYDDSVNLKKVTESSTDANLSYRFNDLAKVTNQASKQLTSFMSAFSTSIDEYIKTTEQAEEVAAENIRKQIDQFAEAAAKISKLKM